MGDFQKKTVWASVWAGLEIALLASLQGLEYMPLQVPPSLMICDSRNIIPLMMYLVDGCYKVFA